MKKQRLTKIRTLFGITEYRLSNGLRVLHKRETAAPVVAVCVTFHVGSRNEAQGHTGSTHLLEHLLFKDSKKFSRKNGRPILQYLEELGGYTNASTWLDRTNYYEIMPRGKLAAAIELEADRMRNSLFNAADLASEMIVVRNEYERSRNNPFELLDEELMAAAFRVHPYRIPTIGTKEDIEGATVGKLREFYETFYWPNNATLAVFGDASWNEVQKMVLRYFGPIPPSPHPIPVMTIAEPEQKKRRSAALSQPLGISIVSLGYKIPAGTHRDFPALYALAMILAGGFSSRLQKALVDSGLAADIAVAAMPLHDPGIMTFTAHVAEGTTPERVRDTMRRSIASAAREISRAELRRAQERILSQVAYERDGVFTEIRAVSESIAAGDWTLGLALEQAAQKLKPSDIMRTAKKYLYTEKETSAILRNAIPNS